MKGASVLAETRDPLQVAIESGGWALVDHAVTRPFVCVVCRSSTGPFTRTFKENFDGEIYLCEDCTGRSAKVHGLVKGGRQMQLINSARLLEAKDREIAERAEREVALQAELDQERARSAELEQERDVARGEAEQLEHLRQAAKEILGDPTVEHA